MKVYVVSWFSAEPYTYDHGVEKCFYKKSDAQKFIDDHDGVVLDADHDDCDDGRMISNVIEEVEVI